MNNELKEKMTVFLGLQKDKLGVVSTVNRENQSQSTFIYYAFDEELNIYFACRDTSRKYKNILSNKNVSFVVAAGDPPQTLQIEGTATVEHDPENQKHLFQELVALPSSKKFSAPISQMPTGGLQFIKISPTWMRFGNFEVRKHENTFQEIKVNEE